MKGIVTVAAFTISSFVSFRETVTPTPLEAISGAPKVELYFHADTGADYLEEVRSALVQRGIDLQFTRVRYDAEGKLAAIAFEVEREGVTTIATSAEVSGNEGAYLYIDFA